MECFKGTLGRVQQGVQGMTISKQTERKRPQCPLQDSRAEFIWVAESTRNERFVELQELGFRARGVMAEYAHNAFSNYRWLAKPRSEPVNVSGPLPLNPCDDEDEEYVWTVQGAFSDAFVEKQKKGFCVREGTNKGCSFLLCRPRPAQGVLVKVPVAAAQPA